MKELERDIIRFFEKQRFVVFCTVDPDGSIHSSAKGIVGIDAKGKVLLLDLYTGRTFKNICHNPHVCITAIDERQYIGYNLKGKAKIIECEKINDEVIQKWKDKITSRISHRILENIREDKLTKPDFPEVDLPSPKRLIEVSIEAIVDLAPRRSKSNKA